MSVDDPAHAEEESYDSGVSGYTGVWTVEGSVVPVWVDKETPPSLVDSNKHDPLSSVLEKMGIRLVEEVEQPNE